MPTSSSPESLTLPKDAMRRLRAIQELSELGSGFKLAIQDLEIRGAGNLLGPSQSGHIAAIGFELYTQLMEKAVRELKGEDVARRGHAGDPVSPPRLHSGGLRGGCRRTAEPLSRLSLSRSDEEVEEIREELADRFGKIPVEAENLLEVIKIKILLTRLAIAKFEVTPSRMVVTFHEKTRVSPQKVVDCSTMERAATGLPLNPNCSLKEGLSLSKIPLERPETLLQALS